MLPFEAYKKGYEQGRKDNLGGNVAQAVLGMLQDDPGGHHAAGYRDGAGGAKFNPPAGNVSQATSKRAVRSSASDREKAWWALCDSSDFIVQEIAEYYSAALKAEGKTVSFVIGLNSFTGFTCPRCSLTGQFKIQFLGRLQHAGCGWQGFMPTGSYIAHQIAQIFHTGARAGGSMKSDADNKGDKQGGWVYGVLVFLVVAITRALAAIVLVPLHAAVALCQPNQPREATITRAVVLVVMLVGFGIFFFKLSRASP